MKKDIEPPVVTDVGLAVVREEITDNPCKLIPAMLFQKRILVSILAVFLESTRIL